MNIQEIGKVKVEEIKKLFGLKNNTNANTNLLYQMYFYDKSKDGSNYNDDSELSRFSFDEMFEEEIARLKREEEENENRK